MWRQPSSFHHANICVCNSVWKCRLPQRRNLCLLWFWLALLYKLGTLTHAQLLQAYLHAALWLWHLEKKKALGGNSNLASRAVHSLTSELGSADYLWPRHPWICIICCPRLPSALSIFNIGSALCLSLCPLPSPLLYYHFISPRFSPHLWLSPPRSWGIITQCTGWRFIHYHIKGFLMPHWLAHCYCWGWLNI